MMQNLSKLLGLCQCGISWPPWHALSGPTLNIQAYSNSQLPQTKTSQNGGFTLAALAAFSKPSGLVNCRCDADRLRNALETLQVPLLLESNMSSAWWQRANTEIWLFFVVNCCKHGASPMNWTWRTLNTSNAHDQLGSNSKSHPSSSGQSIRGSWNDFLAHIVRSE